VHGYHPYVEDAEIYVPGIKTALNPALYPHNAEFFASHAGMTLFPNLIAGSVKLTGLSLDGALLAWHFSAIFLLLLACWELGRICFADRRARWGGVALVASLLTIPVAGTALYIMDQYLSPRSLSTPGALFIVINVMERKFGRAALWAAFTAAIHPLMVVFALAYAALLLGLGRGRTRAGEAQPELVLPPLLTSFPPVSGAYREVLGSHSYFFVTRWEWYEWLGIAGPLVLLGWFERVATSRDLPAVAVLCRTTIVFVLMFFLPALLISSVPGLARFAELQPMRCLQLAYILLFVIAGGLLGQFVLRGRVWAWAALFAAICAGMWFPQRELFPATPHLEWPGRAPHNEWVEGFEWIRAHTPIDAYFALNPDHMNARGEDQHGFRAIAERSRLADRVKDSGAVSMFPKLAATWWEQVRAQDGWTKFQPADLLRLKHHFGVNWVVLEQPGLAGLDCPYQNTRLMVCQLE